MIWVNAPRPTINHREDWDAPVPATTGTLSRDGLVGVIDRRDARGELGLTFFDPADGQVLADVSWPGLLTGSRYQFSGDSKRLAVGVVDAESSGLLVRRPIKLSSGRLVEVVGTPSGHEFDFDGTGERLYAARLHPADHHFRLLEGYDVASGRRLFLREGELNCPGVAVSPAPGGPVATTDNAGQVHLREPGRDTEIAHLKDRLGPTDSLAFSIDGHRLALGGDRVALLWDLDTPGPPARLENLGGWVESIDFLPGTPDLALGLGEGQVVIWHTEPLAEPMAVEAHDDEVWGVVFLSDGQSLATIGGDELLKIHDLDTGRTLHRLNGHKDWPSTLAASPDGRLLASGDFSGAMLIWDAVEGRLLQRIDAHTERVRDLAFSPDGRLLASGGRDALIHLWDTTTWECVATLRGHTRDVRGLAFAPDGPYLASTSDDESIAIWDLASKERLARWEHRTNPICIAFSPDGTTLATGDYRGGVTLRDAIDGTVRAHLPSLHSEEISDLVFSPDGRVLAVAGQDNVVSLVDVATGQPHLTLPGHTDGVNALAFSPDGRLLASASHDHTVRLWWAGRGEPLTMRKP